MLKYIEWFEKIKKMTNDSKIKQKQIKDSEYTFEKYILQNGEKITEEIIEDLKLNIEEAAKKGENHVAFSSCYFDPIPKRFKEIHYLVQNIFSHYKFDCYYNEIHDYSPRFRGPSKFDWVRELKPYFAKKGFCFNVNCGKYGILSEFYIEW